MPWLGSEETTKVAPRVRGRARIRVWGRGRARGRVRARAWVRTRGRARGRARVRTTKVAPPGSSLAQRAASSVTPPRVQRSGPG